MTYKIIKELDNDENSVVELIEDTGGKRFVRRIMRGKVDVYLTLHKLLHRFLPKIEAAEFDGENTVIVEEYIENIGDLSCLDGECEIINAFCELCEVLNFIHGQGIIHRDIKPSNVLVANDGHIRLIDFDAARRYKEESSNDTRYLGTKGYAAPEQFGFAQTDFTADIYALGVTMKTVMGSLAQSRKYRDTIRKCTEFDPVNRYQSASAVRRSLRFGKVRTAVGIAVTVVLLTGTAVLILALNGFGDTDENISVDTTTALTAVTEVVSEGVYEFVSPSEENKTEAAANGHIRDTDLEGRWITVEELDDFGQEAIEQWIDEESDTFLYDDTLDLQYMDFYYGGTYYAYYLFHSETNNWNYGEIKYNTSYDVENTLSYYIYRIDGEDCLFLEKKDDNGCYVLKKDVREYVSPQDSSRIADVIYDIPETDEYGNVKYHSSLTEEYEFVNDPDLIGKWVGVDYIDAYDVTWIYDKNMDTADLWYKKIDFRDDGSCTYYLGEDMEQADHRWTYGLVILEEGTDIKSYMIYNINGEEYLYIEDRVSNPSALNGYEIGYYIFKRG
ncbi:MAG: serine/threonine protein kinase [Oscillospiraceae bacterium]|nr:serine/threonine protein kinase [Oscillospiraceae bacterium]